MEDRRVDQCGRRGVRTSRGCSRECPPPGSLRFFFDRSLGKSSASRLRAHGWTTHLIAEFYPDDAANVPDEVWIAEGCSRGWILLTKDKKIRYRAQELQALERGQLFCLASGNLQLEQMAQRFIDAEGAILRAAARTPVGFWHVLEHGRVTRMWP
ncbi:toxin-antitoxin system, toxin component, PIN family protein [Kribbella sandramycini]|uniref:Toxin-antitoxin system, toxin component, PIN family protein n=1 Tax=Kribbella sandramycini TaxID=60450 RepID=A0A7Y4NZB8_9ACTN|nr:toxin-antitoxin system, toxin component, PIN family protein [Kribbella sandramycini]